MQANSHYFAIIEQVYTSKRSSFTYMHLCGYINELCVQNLLNNYDGTLDSYLCIQMLFKYVFFFFVEVDKLKATCTVYSPSSLSVSGKM